MKSLLFRGWLQVFCVSVQTWFLAQNFYPGVAVGGFMISFVWTLNVRSMAIGGWSERIVYSTGAMAGALSGLWVGNLIL
jgi:hypothetical protein